MVYNSNTSESNRIISSYRSEYERHRRCNSSENNTVDEHQKNSFSFYPESYRGPGAAGHSTE
jgi:hypothetical protein